MPGKDQSRLDEPICYQAMKNASYLMLLRMDLCIRGGGRDPHFQPPAVCVSWGKGLGRVGQRAHGA